MGAKDRDEALEIARARVLCATDELHRLVDTCTRAVAVIEHAATVVRERKGGSGGS